MSEPVTGASTEVEAPHRKRPSWAAGLLPFIGVILFMIATIRQFAGGAGPDWGPALVANAVTYLIGWAALGAGVTHLFFGKQISKTIGFEKSPYELEVGFADLAMGIAGVLAARFSPDYWFAVILISSIFRVGCGVGHIRSMIRDRNFAINNTAILAINFVVPAFLLVAYFLWAR